MRVVWVGHRDIDHPRAGGAERTAFEVARRLVDRGHSVTLVGGRWPGGPRVVEHANVRVERPAGPLSLHAVWPIRVRELRAEVVVEDLAHVVPFGTPRWTSAPGTAFFHHLHARTLPHQVPTVPARLLAEVERRYPRTFADWPVVTESTRSTADLQSLGFPPDRLRRIPPGVDSDRFRPGQKTPHPSVVYFGGLRDYKRPRDALRAFARVAASRPELTMTIVGEGPSRAALEREAHDLGVSDRARFVGRLPAVEVARTVASAWANVHCAEAEGWCLSVAEASAAGVPTAGYDVPGLEETLRDGVNGLKAPDGQVDALATQLARLLDAPSDWVERCRSFATPFTWERCADGWESHLASLV